MNQTIKSCLQALAFGFILAVTGNGVASAESTVAKEIGDTTMALHHLHSLMNHALRMVLQGQNLVILSEMSAARRSDTTPEEHVRAMLESGKALLRRAMMDEEMKVIHARGADAKLMRYTHALGEAMQKVVASLDKTSVPRPEKGSVALHHLRMHLNQALIMATEGSDIIMLGRMEMTPKVDKASIAHGQVMLIEARKLWQEATEGKAMQDLMRPGRSEESAAMMPGIRELLEAATKVLDLLAEMYLHQQ